MRRDGDLELQGRRRSDVDFELRPDVSLHRTDGTIAPPSESQVDRAAARGVSTTVDGIGAAAGGGPPISAWLPITRASLMCVKAVSLSARRSERCYMARGSHRSTVDQRRACCRVEMTASVESALRLRLTPLA